MSVNYLIEIFIFIFGLCIGSFLNCVVYRLEKKEKLAGRSYCPQCKNTLSWTDLFPVFSFLCLWGKCRYCKTKISLQYPIVEIVTALMFLIIFNFQFFPMASPSRILEGFTLGTIFSFMNIAFLFYVACVLIIIFVYDFKYYLIPDKILFPAIGVIFIWRLIFNFQFLIFNFLIAAIVASGFFLSIFLVSRGRWMGFGDVKLAIFMGLLLGLPNVLVALFLAFFFGAIIGTTMMVLNKKSLKSEIPFGPFLITGTFIALFWSQQIVSWYVNFFLI